MTRRKPVRAIRQPSNSGGGADDILEFEAMKFFEIRNDSGNRLNQMTLRIDLTIRIDSTDILIWSSHLI